MAGTDVSGVATSARSTQGVDMNLEVVTVPVSDVDRAKSFYESIGWRFDIDLVVSDEIRTVQFTPPHSQCSIQFGKGENARSYFARASFSDPDGNRWQLQEITTRLPGREWED
jgi:hypothetical protein